jgi:hypothetical protein
MSFVPCGCHFLNVVVGDDAISYTEAVSLFTSRFKKVSKSGLRE